MNHQTFLSLISDAAADCRTPLAGRALAGSGWSRSCWRWLSMVAVLLCGVGTTVAQDPPQAPDASATPSQRETAADKHASDKHIVLVAGKPSHPPRMHEFKAGSMLMAECLKDVPGLKVSVVLGGWPKDESIFDSADAIVFFMDGGGGHEVVQENGRRKVLIDGLVDKGVGIGCMHFGVEVVADQAGKEFKKWIGGHYEHMFSCNPIWEPAFSEFPQHPITRGVKPFQVKDEWYMNMRFVADISGNAATEVDDLKFTPILVAAPADEVRDGPYVYPNGPYTHIQANKGRAEAMMWAVERVDGGRGFGFTGGHFHDNWSDDSYRKVVLNALLWIAQKEVPENGVESQVTPELLDANLDKK